MSKRHAGTVGPADRCLRQRGVQLQSGVDHLISVAHGDHSATLDCCFSGSGVPDRGAVAGRLLGARGHEARVGRLELDESGKLTLHSPTRWPWAERFNASLTNLRALILLS